MQHASGDGKDCGGREAGEEGGREVRVGTRAKPVCYRTKS